jgi:hypothetical protein
VHFNKPAQNEDDNAYEVEVFPAKNNKCFFNIDVKQKVAGFDTPVFHVNGFIMATETGVDIQTIVANGWVYTLLTVLFAGVLV